MNSRDQMNELLRVNESKDATHMRSGPHNCRARRLKRREEYRESPSYCGSTYDFLI